MAGGRAKLRWSTTMNSMDFFGTSVLSAGFVSAPDEKGWHELRDLRDGHYAKVVLRDDVLKGFVLLGDTQRAGLYLCMMRRETSVERLREQLLSPDFSLADLPTHERRRMLKEAVTLEGS